MIPNNNTSRGDHIWHFCKINKHEKCAEFGSLTKRRYNPERTYVLQGVKNSGLENVYCECPCHARKEVFNVVRNR